MHTKTELDLLSFPLTGKPIYYSEYRKKLNILITSTFLSYKADVKQDHFLNSLDVTFVEWSKFRFLTRSFRDLHRYVAALGIQILYFEQ